MSMLVFVLVTVSAMVAAQSEGSCPLWFRQNSTTGNCYCGDDLGGVIHCNRERETVYLHFCYGMTYNKHTNETVVGQCLYTCESGLVKCGSYNRLPRYSDRINDKMCSPLNRTGQLCGKCSQGYGLPVYSYTVKCVDCSDVNFPRSLFRYLAVAYLPLTAFYIVVVTFKISVTSGRMVAYILICQILTMPTLLQAMTLDDSNHLVLSWVTLWNLDAFRLIMPPFCLHHQMTILHVLALDYVIGVYPLFLILLTYIAVKLYDRYSMMEKLWRPAYRVFTGIRREWDIRGTLIQAFATFFVLSYVKILNVSIDLLTPVYLRNIHGDTIKQTYLYLNGEVLLFGSEHLPYGILAVIMLTVFNLLPMLVLLLYPCQCFQRCLRKFRLNVDFVLPLLDTFQGCYRPNCRYFAGMYLLVRAIFLITLALVKFATAYSLFGFYFLALTLIITLLSPYKQSIHNKLESVFFLFSASGFFISGFYKYLGPAEPQIPGRLIFITIMIPLGAILVLYGVVMLSLNILPRRFFLLLRGCWQWVCSKMKGDGNQDGDEAFLQQLEQEPPQTNNK